MWVAVMVASRRGCRKLPQKANTGRIQRQRRVLSAPRAEDVFRQVRETMLNYVDSSSVQGQAYVQQHHPWLVMEKFGLNDM